MRAVVQASQSYARPPQYDDAWLREGIRKRDSNYSPILTFETTDPRRQWGGGGLRSDSRWP